MIKNCFGFLGVWAFRRGAAAAFFCLALLAAGSVARGQSLGLTAQLILKPDILLPAEDMNLKLRIVNRSGQTLLLGGSDDWVTFTIQDATGFIAPILSPMANAGPFTLATGMMGTRDFNPAPNFDFRKPGRYTISAQIQIPQWHQTISCKPIAFTVVEGTPLPGMANLEFGLPTAPDQTNTAPVTRRYSLLRVAYQDELKLYFRLTDSSGQILRCCAAGRLLSFSVPEARIDPFNNLHLLWQTGAKEFTYLVYTPDGGLLLRETHAYTDTRPTLVVNEHNNVEVAGGVRVYSAGDIPSPIRETAAGK